MSKQVYIIGSLRNARVPDIGNAIRNAGLLAFDDWWGAGDEADDKWQEYENIRGRGYAEALAGAAAQTVFNFDKTNILASDAVLLVLPAGKSGHIEFGFARGKEKLGVILLDGEPDRFDVMYNFASLVTSNLDEAVAFFKDSLATSAHGRCARCDGPHSTYCCPGV